MKNKILNGFGRSFLARIERDSGRLCAGLDWRMSSTHVSAALLSQKYQVVFSIFFIVAAFLFRENTKLVYPQILYLSMLMLAFNFVAGFSLRLWPFREWVTGLIIMGNCAVITAILSYSGGQESNLWVLYLLPIYTVCLLLNGQEVAWITAGAVSFNWAFYITSVSQWNAVTFFELAIKSSIFILAGVVTWHVVGRERNARRGLEAKREEMARLTNKLQYQESCLEQTGKLAELGQAASGVAHDLNGPLTVILGTVEIAIQEQEVHGQIKEDLDRISRSAQLCRNIVANILGYIRKSEWKRVPCQINEVIESVLSLYGVVLAKKNIKVRKELGSGLPEITASIPDIQRVLWNLISNAGAAMGERGTLSIRTETCAVIGKLQDIKIVVEDTGPGIPEASMKTLFEPFRTTKAPGEGTGLGLYLSREIILKHGGSLTAENAQEGGARFIITLPCTIYPPVSAGARS